MPLLPGKGEIREEPAACRECWERERRKREVRCMKPSKTTTLRVTDAIKRCMRGETYDRCEKECFYGRQYKNDCQKRMMGDALKLIEAQMGEIADQKKTIDAYEEDE